MNLDACPHCGMNLLGEPIPDTDPVRHYHLDLLAEIPEMYDGGLFYACPRCNGRWHRWPEGSHLRNVAAPYVDRLERTLGDQA